MAHPVIDPEQIPKPEGKSKVQVMKEIVTVTKERVPVIVDSLVLITIAFWYYFFTGLAIILRSPIPKEWLQIGTHISGGKLAQKVAGMKEVMEERKPKNSFRVVDLETKRNIVLDKNGNPTIPTL